MDIVKEYSVVIPVYNTERSLRELAERIAEQFRTLNNTYELIFVDDASTNPATWTTLHTIAQSDPNVQVIRLMRNFGQQAATMCGIRQSRSQFIITMDDDLQHLPEDIPKLISSRQHDVVIGQLRQKKHGLIKRTLSRVKGYFDQIILGKPKGIQLSSFRLINRITVIGMTHLFDTPYPFLPAIIFYVTRDVAGVEVSHGARHEGKTGYTFFSMMRLMSNLIINNSSLLLRIMGNLGLALSGFMFLLALYFAVRKLFYTTTIVGWTSVIVTVLFIGGLFLFCIGIIGEYLIRIIHGVDKRPNYIIREHLKSGGSIPNS
jgi:glycosyltransferase involved in cell wall biosynthesis